MKKKLLLLVPLLCLCLITPLFAIVGCGTSLQPENSENLSGFEDITPENDNQDQEDEDAAGCKLYGIKKGAYVHVKTLDVIRNLEYENQKDPNYVYFDGNNFSCGLYIYVDGKNTYITQEKIKLTLKPETENEYTGSIMVLQESLPFEIKFNDEESFSISMKKEGQFSYVAEYKFAEERIFEKEMILVDHELGLTVVISNREGLINKERVLCQVFGDVIYLPGQDIGLMIYLNPKSNENCFALIGNRNLTQLNENPWVELTKIGQ